MASNKYHLYHNMWSAEVLERSRVRLSWPFWLNNVNMYLAIDSGGCTNSLDFKCTHSLYFCVAENVIG